MDWIKTEDGSGDASTDQIEQYNIADDKWHALFYIIELYNYVNKHVQASSFRKTTLD